VAAGQVLIVSADERWLRVLEVTIRLRGAETISRHSIGEALHVPTIDGQHPTAIVMDLGAQTSQQELDDVRGILHDNSLPAVVILPERLAAEGQRLEAVGATVLVRPYRPSELYAALWPDETVDVGALAASDEPLTVSPDDVDPSDDTARGGEA
jgi:DNA-binding response OmpR family regulator